MSRETSPHLVLIETGEGEEERVFPLSEGSTRVGRSKENDIRLDDSAVSRFHCYLERRDGEVRIHDLSSHNSTWVDHTAVDRGIDREEGLLLRDGSVIQLGRCKLIFHDRTSSAPVSQTGGVKGGRARRRRRARKERVRPITGGASALASEAEVKEPCSPPGGSARGARARRRRARARTARGRRFVAREYGYYAAALLLLLVFGLLVYLDPGGRLFDGRRVPPEDGDDAVAVLGRRLRETRVALSKKEKLLERLEERIVSTQNDLESLRGGSGTELESLMREIALLESRERRLESEQSRAADVDRSRTAARVEREMSDREFILRASARLEEEDPFLEPLPGEEGGEESAGDSPPRTGVTRPARVPPPEGEERTPEEIEGLVQELLARVDEYAFPSTSPRDLEPALTRLGRTRGLLAARGLLTVHHHARDLLAGVDRNIARMEARQEALLREAEREGGPKGEGSGYDQPRRGPDVEKKQRLLELSERTMEIKKGQRERLLALREAVLERVKELTGPETLGYLASHFVEEDDVAERLALLSALRQGGEASVVPVIARTLSIRSDDPAVLRALRETLTAITGVDLGGRRAVWEAWWRERDNET